MSDTEELRKRFEDNFISHPHEDDDYGICASHISVCSKCKKEFYYLNLEKCKCKAPCVQKPCTCGADKIKEEQFEWLLSEIEQAEKAKVEEVIGILKRIACFEIPVTNERDQGFVDALDSAISQVENKFLNTP